VSLTLGALLIAWGVYLLLLGLRLGLALRFVRRERAAAVPVPGDDSAVTVLQAILSGDPHLEQNLAENLRHHPTAHFVWLIDEDDGVARALAVRLLEEHRGRPGRVEVLLAPPPPQGSNPKVFKLVLGFPQAGELVAVLDDDTVLPAGALAHARAALARGDLVTGLPWYRAEGPFFSRLLAAFVNSNALLTYLPILAFRPPVTINGMFSLTRKATLEQVGGFAAIEARLCDDYELAQLYLRAGLAIVQTTVAHPIATTVRGPLDYGRILRRWMVFANHLFRERLDLSMLVLVVLPALLPLVLVVLAGLVGAGALAATLGGLLAKAALLSAVRHRVLASREGAAGVFLEVLADLLQPFHAATALVRPRAIRWRSRSIVVEDGKVGYR
jgi:ceramide glucosyltransferase